ncbi:MAG TPA: hypothetical protein VGU46_10860 [Acidobacteriaceae bacterium]|nr:hypothetical protein [Acidobacteriaceae bacterium]
MPDPKRPLAESILAWSAGSTRAAAIYGDLLEISATRSRLWFAAAYLRTLVSFTRRIVLALFVAEVCRQLIFDAFHIYLQYQPDAWRNAHGPYLEVLHSSGPLLACIMSTLWFALPFAAIRYGMRDRFVRLTLALAVGTTLALFSVPFASAVSAALTLILAAIALSSRTWRSAALALATIGIAGLAALTAVLGLVPLLELYLRERLTDAHLVYRMQAPMLAFQCSLLVIAIVCSIAHRHCTVSSLR